MKRGDHKPTFSFATNFSWWFGEHWDRMDSRLEPGFLVVEKPG